MFHGYNVNEHFLGIDFVSMPSIYESYLLTALGTLSNGIAIIATLVSGITELMKNACRRKRDHDDSK